MAVVGAGAAGLMAAIAASETVQTLLLTDGPIGRANSAMAQGGLHVPFDTAESRRSMAEDMVRSARTPVDRDRVDEFVGAVRPTVALLESWGLALDRDDAGALVRRTAGGLSEPRIVTAGDRIGPALMAVLEGRLRASVTVAERAGVAAIEPGEPIVLLREDGGAVSADAVVVCTGGLSHFEAQRSGLPTTNPPNANHGMFGVLRDLGLPAVDEGVFQFQPFGLVEAPGSVGRCVPESVVGLGVRVLDGHGLEVAPAGADRLTVTEAMHAAIDAGRGVETPAGSGVTLTLSDVDPAVLAASYPSLCRTLERMGALGGDVVVRPFLHYHLGGLAATPDGETVIPGLFVAGEMVGGLHGRNRLMGNGITDSLVHGRRAGVAAARLVSR